MTTTGRLPAATAAQDPGVRGGSAGQHTRKAAALRKHFGRAPEGVTLVPVDFETHGFRAELGRHGFTGGRKTFVVWEAVTQYLTEPAVRHEKQLGRRPRSAD